MIKAIVVTLQVLAVICLSGAVSEAQKLGRKDIADLAAGLFLAALAALIAGVSLI